MRIALFLILACLGFAHSQNDAKVSPKRSIVWGPGLNGNIVTPARYIYIAARTASGRNFTTSPGANAFSVKITMLRNGQNFPLNVQLHDRADGSYVALFWYNQQPERLTIEVLCNPDGKGEKHVAKSPYVIEKPEIESCYCPRDHQSFMSNWECSPKDMVRIGHDFIPFPKGSFTQERLYKAIRQLDNGKNCFIHYTFKNNLLYGRAYGPHVGFKKFSDEYLLSVARRVQIPDVEFILNLGDWPLAANETSDFPVISWCGSTDTNDLVLPTYKIILGNVYGRDVENLAQIDGGMSRVKRWRDKIPKAFWRGRDSNPERVKLVFEIAPEHQDLYDVKLSKNHFNYYPSEEDRRKDIASGMYAKKVERVDMVQYFNYKYLLNIDGTVSAYRYPALLAGDSLTFLQDSKYYEHFYHELEPYKHYLPVSADLSDLTRNLKWAAEHDAEAENIAKNAREFSRTRLRVEDAYCYYYQMFVAYAAHQSWTPAVGSEQFISPQEAPAGGCTCAEREGKREWPLEKFADDSWRQHGDVPAARSSVGKVGPGAAAGASALTYKDSPIAKTARLLFLNGQAQECVDLLRSKLGESSEDVSVHDLLAECLSMIGDDFGVEMHRLYAVSLRPDIFSLQDSLASFFVAKKKYREAMEVWDSASRVNSIGKKGLLYSALVGISSGLIAAARTRLTEALPLLPAQVGLSLLPSPVPIKNSDEISAKYFDALIAAGEIFLKQNNSNGDAALLQKIVSNFDTLPDFLKMRSGDRKYKLAAEAFQVMRATQKNIVAANLLDFSETGMIEDPDGEILSGKKPIVVCVAVMENIAAGEDIVDNFVFENLKSLLSLSSDEKLKELKNRLKIILLVTDDTHKLSGADKTIKLPLNFKKAVTAIESLNVHVLLYVGRKFPIFWAALANSRLAPTQMVFSGLGDSSGIPTIDIFIRNGPLLPTDVSGHSETVASVKTFVPLSPPGISSDWNRQRNYLIAGCNAAGIPTEFDLFLVELLKSDSVGSVTFVESDTTSVLVYKQRLGSLFPAAGERVNPAPKNLNCSNWLESVGIFTAILDPNFSSENHIPAFAALSAGVPTFVFPNTPGANFAKQLNVATVIAPATPKEYAMFVTAAANQRDNISKTLKTSLLENAKNFKLKAAHEWMQLFIDSVESKICSPIPN